MFFFFFGVGGDFEIFIAISQCIWGVGDCRDRLLRGIIVGRGRQSVGVRGVMESNFIINYNFWLFLFFLVVMEVA